MVKIERQFAMPNSSTFQINCIRDLIKRNKKNGKWVDPFSGSSDIADVTNDLNPDIDADYNMTAQKFLEMFDDNEVNGGVLFDPPYSPRQIKECYDKVGLEVNQQTTQSSTWADWKDEIQRICQSGSVVISFGWNSGGMGKTRNFRKKEILLVYHGSEHNDTICTVEDKL